jgi:alanine-synthesizing transaminase
MFDVFSSRLPWDLQPNPLTAALEAKRAAGTPLFDLTESNPTASAGLEYPRAILDSLADPEALRYQPAPRGLLSARQAVSHYYAERGREVPPARILLTASTSEAYAYLFKLLTDPGDQILTPRPSYPLFEFLAAMESVEPRQYSLRYDGSWHLDFGSLERAITARTRAIVVVNPNNPTGSFLKPDEIDRLDALAAAHGIAILSDEVFSDYAFGPTSPPPEYSRSLAFSMSGLSKLAGLPQMKLGWIVAQGPDHPAALDRLELIADTYLSVSTPVQLALPNLLASSAAVRTQIQQRTRENRAWLRTALAGSAAQVLTTEGGWSAVLQIPRIRTEEEWALHLLIHHDVLVQPGFFFDFEAEAFLVVSLLTPEPAFNEGIRRVLTSLQLQ